MVLVDAPAGKPRWAQAWGAASQSGPRQSACQLSAKADRLGQRGFDLRRGQEAVHEARGEVAALEVRIGEDPLLQGYVGLDPLHDERIHGAPHPRERLRTAVPS